jgi:hypothetical protein
MTETAAPCPVCHEPNEVRTLAEAFALLDQVQETGLHQAEQVASERPEESSQDWLINDQSSKSADPEQQVADVAVAAASHLLSRVLKRGLRRAANNMEAAVDPRSDRARAQRERVAQDHAVLVQRYPDARVCLRAQVGFEVGRPKAVSLAGIRKPVTADQVDALVAELRSS